MKKLTAALFTAFSALILAGLLLFRQQSGSMPKNDADTYKTYEYHYAMITGTEDGDLWDRIYKSALEEGKAHNAYVERFGEHLSMSYDRHELISLAIEASVDGIIVPGDDDEETAALLNKAVEKGIPVVTVLQDITGSLRQCFVGCNSYNLGQEYGRQILRLLAEKEDDRSSPYEITVLTNENHVNTTENLILLGIRETLEQYSDKIHPASVDTIPIDNSRSFSSEESIRSLFLNEHLPDILVCLNGLHTRCAYQAAVDHNKVGSVQILGFYDSDAILEAVEKNILQATIAIDTDQMGRLCLQALDEYVRTGYTNSYMAVDIRLFTAQDE